MERITVNPDSYSQLPPKFEDLEYVGKEPHRGNRMYFDTSSQDTYYQLSKEASPQVQEFVAKVLKGIVPLSDVVSLTDPTGNRLFFSKLIHLQDYEHKKTADEVKACMLLLKYVFNDTDHFEVSKQNEESGNISYGNDTFVLYDFGAARYFLADGEYFYPGLLHNIEVKVLEALLEKLTLLKERLHGDDGALFFDAVHRKTIGSLDSNDERLNRFLKELAEIESVTLYQILVNRVTTLLGLVKSTLAHT